MIESVASRIHVGSRSFGRAPFGLGDSKSKVVEEPGAATKHQRGVAGKLVLPTEKQ